MSYPSTDYGYGSDSELDFFDEIRTEAINATDPYVNYKEYDSVLFVRTGNGWRYDFSTLGKQIIETADGEVSLSLSFVTHGDIVLDNGDIALDNGYVAHELIIHGILGLIHANSIDISNGEIFSYGDQWDNRGAQYALIDGLHKYMTGLLGTDQIQIVESSGEYSLDQRELESGGIKLLVIFLGYDGDGEPILYYLEYFKELGEFDSQVFDDSDSDINKNTVLLRKYKREYPYDSVVYVPDSFGREPVDLESQEFCDSDYENLEHYGVCVQVLEKIGTEEESKAKVKITLTEDYNKPSPTPTPPPPCIYSISPASYSHGAGSETGSIEVTASSGSCGWTAVSNAEDWIVITSGSSGAGNGTVYYLVSANTGVAPRTGTMTIAEQTFTVNQDQPPPPCIYSISPASYSHGAGSETGSIEVTASSGSCGWTAVSNAEDWIVITSGSSGAGNGTVYYLVSANTGVAPVQEQ